ncbi:helix-turn-helix domain-containing protein [Aureimonas ureilytica]|uniref:helix-turn-helix domain-containing protein n=1 Tax=Aureimonas ureilytica TaxID=401562 RepID=UPI000364CDDF|nr:helix-turn-helix transcriptional regulator [Aureimonas ureilytica]
MAVQTILQDPERQRLREEGGAWLQKMRLEAGLSQRELAKALDVKYLSFISQIEAGRGRVPYERYLDWANALRMDPREFVATLMSYYDPITYEIIFQDPRQSGATAV